MLRDSEQFWIADSAQAYGLLACERIEFSANGSTFYSAKIAGSTISARFVRRSPSITPRSMLRSGVPADVCRSATLVRHRYAVWKFQKKLRTAPLYPADVRPGTMPFF